MRHTILTVDLGFGDAGKGSIVDYLSRAHNAHTVVRFNGGGQAGHRVVTADGREHIFSHFGSGTFAGAATHLSRFMLVEPLAMEAEAEHLTRLGLDDPFARTTIDRACLLVTPFHMAVNRLRELARGDARHGSCGLGIGETVSDSLDDPANALRAGDLAHPDRLRAKLAATREVNRRKLAAFAHRLPESEQAADELAVLEDRETIEWLLARYRAFVARARTVDGTHLHRLLAAPGAVIFEAAQGVLLDEWRGFHPHTTWSTTTTANAETLLAEAGYNGRITRLGLTRAYTTRHGAGPLPTEDADLIRALPDRRNGEHLWQQGFRVGWLDGVLLRYAADVAGRLDGLAVTCLDRLAALPEIRLCTAYTHPNGRLDALPVSPRLEDLAFQEGLTQTLAEVTPVCEKVEDTGELLERMQSALNLPVRITSWGECAQDKREGVNGGVSASVPPPARQRAAAPAFAASARAG